MVVSVNTITIMLTAWSMEILTRYTKIKYIFKISSIFTTFWNFFSLKIFEIFRCALLLLTSVVILSLLSPLSPSRLSRQLRRWPPSAWAVWPTSLSSSIGDSPPKLAQPELTDIKLNNKLSQVTIVEAISNISFVEKNYFKKLFIFMILNDQKINFNCSTPGKQNSR